MNRKAKYYTPPGSYDGCVRIKTQWYRVTALNRIDKTGWVRWQGPPSRKMDEALKCCMAFESTVLFPERRRYPIPFGAKP